MEVSMTPSDSHILAGSEDGESMTTPTPAPPPPPSPFSPPILLALMANQDKLAKQLSWGSSLQVSTKRPLWCRLPEVSLPVFGCLENRAARLVSATVDSTSQRLMYIIPGKQTER